MSAVRTCQWARLSRTVLTLLLLLGAALPGAGPASGQTGVAVEKPAKANAKVLEGFRAAWGLLPPSEAQHVSIGGDVATAAVGDELSEDSGSEAEITERLVGRLLQPLKLLDLTTLQPEEALEAKVAAREAEARVREIMGRLSLAELGLPEARAAIRAVFQEHLDHLAALAAGSGGRS